MVSPRQREEASGTGVADFVRVAAGKCVGTTADWGQERNLVAFVNRRRAAAKFLIAGQHDARFQIRQEWKIACVAGENGFDESAVGHFDVVFGEPHNIPQHAEK